MPVRTFKAIDNELKFFGFWLPDVLVFFLAVFIPSAVLHSIYLTAFCVVLAAGGLFVIRDRPARYLRDSFRFVVLPGQYIVGFGEDRFR